MTDELIRDLYNKITAALPQYPIFLNEDGTIMRNTENSVEDALSADGVALIVCARVTTRKPADAVPNGTARILSVPIEIRTQALDDVEVPTVSAILDELETAIIKLEDPLTEWTLAEGGEYENRPGWGFLRVEHIYYAGE